MPGTDKRSDASAFICASFFYVLVGFPEGHAAGFHKAEIPVNLDGVAFPDWKAM